MKVSNTKSLKPGQMHGRYIDFAYDCDKGWAKYLVATTAPDDRHLFNFDLELVLTGEKRKKPLKAHLLVLDNYGDEIMPDEIRKEVLSTTMFKETLDIFESRGRSFVWASWRRRCPTPMADSDHLENGVLARKTKQGRWRFEVVEKREWGVPQPAEDALRVGVDVGLNVMAATSSGELLGAELKSKFNALYAKVRAVRANRQRQGFKDQVDHE